MAHLNLVKIGNILKHQRLSLGLSIRELSTKCDVSAGAISQIETGKTAANLVSIYALCEALHFPISALFVEESDERISFVRNNERNSFFRNKSHGEDIFEELIINGEHDMWGGVIKMPPKTNSGDFYVHDGEEFVYILQGELEFSLENTETYSLKQGDTLYYPNEIGHKWENISEKDCEFMIVSTTRFDNT